MKAGKEINDQREETSHSGGGTVRGGLKDCIFHYENTIKMTYKGKNM